MTFSLVNYGFEPEVFKRAFKQGWSLLDQPGLDGKQKEVKLEPTTSTHAEVKLTHE